MRRRYAGTSGVFGLLFALTLAGCSPSKPEEPTPPGGTKPVGTSTAPKGSLKVALVLDVGGPDDKSFNAAACAGLERAKGDLGIDTEKSKYVTSQSPGDYKANLSQFGSQKYDIVFAVGYKMEEALKEVAPLFPSVKFVLVDGNAPDLPNCAALQFKEEQGALLAGYLAGAMTKKKMLGFVGGEEIPLIKKFEAGYRAGAKIADPAIQVKTAYTGDWDSLDKGKSSADQIFGNGADIIFHAAGKGGLGVIRAAEAKGVGYYAIGVDQDQDGEARGRVLTSMVKRLDNAVYDTIKRAKEGKFTAGTHVYDLKEQGVGISEMKYTKQDVPAEVLKKLETLRTLIAEGKVIAPTKVEEVDAFQPPKL